MKIESRLILCLLGTASILACSAPGEVGFEVLTVEVPAAPGSGEPNLAVGADGKLYLSWIEPAGDGAHALRFAIWQGEAWSAPRTIATGNDWFVNWADFPSMAALADGTLAAHWLVRSGESTYAYGVRVSISTDGGASWSDPAIPHSDRSPTEHGFVSMVAAQSASAFDLVWLDGREMSGGHDGGEGGPMTLRTARLEPAGTINDERLIDERVCDCCQTDLVRTASGDLVVAYRDRSDEEVRDVSVARGGTQGWTAPTGVHRDGWVMPACPVNGPAMAEADDRLAVAWFTGAEESGGQVRLAFSSDGGSSFAPPIRVDSGEATGRVDLVLMEDGSAVVSWLGRGAIRLRRVAPSGRVSEPLVVSAADESRAGGFPRLARLGAELFMAWTEPGEPSRVRGARLRRPAE